MFYHKQWEFSCSADMSVLLYGCTNQTRLKQTNDYILLTIIEKTLWKCSSAGGIKHNNTHKEKNTIAFIYIYTQNKL